MGQPRPHLIDTHEKLSAIGNRIIVGAAVVIFGPVLLLISPLLLVFWAIGSLVPFDPVGPDVKHNFERVPPKRI